MEWKLNREFCGKSSKWECLSKKCGRILIERGMLWKVEESVRSKRRAVSGVSVILSLPQTYTLLYMCA